MDNALRAEFRAWKIETESQISALQDRVKSLEDAAQASSVDAATTTSKKSKTASTASVEADTSTSSASASEDTTADTSTDAANG